MSSKAVNLSEEQELLWLDLPLSQRTIMPGQRSRRQQSRSKFNHGLGLTPYLADPSRVLLLDVETTGLSRYYDELTIVGYELDGFYGVYIVGDDPKDLLNTISSSLTLVTFNGTLFDIPFLKKTFENLILPPHHVDLRYAAKRVGLTGGQKAIERQLGIDVRDGLGSVDGAEAVLLWHQYLRGDLGALRRLIEYNRADVRGMAAILDHIVEVSGASSDLIGRATSLFDRYYGVTGAAEPEATLPSPARLGRRSQSFAELFRGTPAERATIIGVDLTGSEKRPSGVCVLRGSVAETSMLSTDDQILAAIQSNAPVLVSIDSPLCLPYGRISVTDDDPGRDEFGIMRVCERTLKRRGINVYPCLLPSMQRLTQRGMELASRLRASGTPVIESYPGAAQDIMGIPRKGAGEHWLKQGLADFGVGGNFLTENVRHDELDAITSALVGSFFLAGKYEALGGPDEDPLIVPDLRASPGPFVIGVSGRIAAGKTTVARLLESWGFAYTRYSLVIDDEIRLRGDTPNRETRQQVGFELHQTKGQRWLSERVVERVGNSPQIIVDGLRWPEDAAFFFERFGSRFLHLHIDAPKEVRSERYCVDPENGSEFETADNQPVESKIDELGNLAAARIINDSTLGVLREKVQRIVEAAQQEVRDQCQSQ